MDFIEWVIERRYPIVIMAASFFWFGLIIFTLLVRPISSSDLLEKHYSGQDVTGDKVEVVVTSVDRTLMFGEYLLEADRTDTMYVTYDRTSLQHVGRGDKVEVIVSDISEVLGVSVITITEANIK